MTTTNTTRAADPGALVAEIRKRYSNTIKIEHVAPSTIKDDFVRLADALAAAQRERDDAVQKWVGQLDQSRLEFQRLRSGLDREQERAENAEQALRQQFLVNQELEQERGVLRLEVGNQEHAARAEAKTWKQRAISDANHAGDLGEELAAARAENAALWERVAALVQEHRDLKAAGAKAVQCVQSSECQFNADICGPDNCEAIRQFFVPDTAPPEPRHE